MSRFIAWQSPARPTIVEPTSVTTGTPIQSASRLVVWPLYGKLSRQMSMPRYVAKYSARGMKRTNATRSRATPARSNASRTRWRARPLVKVGLGAMKAAHYIAAPTGLHGFRDGAFPASRTVLLERRLRMHYLQWHRYG